MKWLAAIGLYASVWISVVTRTENPDYRFRDILGDTVEQLVNTHNTTLLIR